MRLTFHCGPHGAARPTGWRGMCGLLLVLGIVLQTITPMRGQAASNGTVMEICSQFGVVQVRIDADGNPVDPDPAPCADTHCTLCISLSQIDLPASFDIVTPVIPSSTAGETHPARVGANPAQFWAANRGPPADTEKAALAGECPTMGPAPFPLLGGAPWA